MSEALQELAAHITFKQPDAVGAARVAHGELTLEVEPDHLLSLVEFLRTDSACRFTPYVYSFITSFVVHALVLTFTSSSIP